MTPKFTQTNESFTTGAQRGSQKGKCRPDLTSPLAQERKGWISAYGAEHYGDRNWEKGMPFSRVIASICRHLMSYMQGDTSEDHLAQLGWNVDALLHFEEMIKLGRLPATLNDLPQYRQRIDILSLGADGNAGTMTVSEKTIPPGFGARGQMLAAILELGIPEIVANQIVGGATFATGSIESAPFCYVAGPMRGIAEFNFPAFDACRESALKSRFHVISPADIDRFSGDENSDNQLAFCLRDFLSIYFIRAHSGTRGAVVMLPGWEKSVGAVAEFFIARWLGLRVLDAQTLQPLAYTDVKLVTLLVSIQNFLDGQGK